MLGRLFGRRPPPEVQPPAPETPEPGLWQRIKVFFGWVWHWTILLAAIAGFLLCLRLTYGFWETARDSTDTDTTLLFGAMAVAGFAGAIFLGWQSWRGIEYIRHHRRRAD